MKLSEFIKDVLVEVSTGISDANSHLGDKFFTNHSDSGVNFEIYVEESKGSNSEGKIGSGIDIKIAKFGSDINTNEKEDIKHFHKLNFSIFPQKQLISIIL